MSFSSPELEELKRKYNALLEGYQKLQGIMKATKATADELSSNIKKVEAERDKYKKAFESIFTENIGDSWEQLPDEAQLL